MNIIETIRAEIERRLSNIVTGLDFTAEIELKGLLSFIDTLPEQPSLPAGVEEAAEEAAIVEGLVFNPAHDVVVRVFKAGVEWGASHAKTPTP